MKRWTLLVVTILLVVLCACSAEEAPVADPAPPEPPAPEPDPEPPPEPEPIVEDPPPTPLDEPAVEEEGLEIIFLDDVIGGGGQMTSEGPWLVFNTYIGLMAVSEDGTEAASFRFPLDDRVASWDVASHGGVVAIVQDTINSTPDNSQKWLEIRALPRNQLLYEVQMLDYDGPPLSFADEREEMDFLQDSIRAVGKVAWANDSLTLAFVSAHEGPSPDVYSYFLQSGEVIQLTSGPSHAVGLSWSPDDAYIFHAGVEKMYSGYSGAGYSGWTFYAAAPDDSGVLTVADGPDDIQLEEMIGWYSDNQVLMASGQWFCGQFDFRMVNIKSGATTMIMEAQHTYSAYDPVNQQALVWVDPQSSDTEECGPASEPGMYLVSVPGGQMEKLEGAPENFLVYQLVWDENGEVFMVQGRDSWLVVDVDGVITEYPHHPAYSMDGKWVAYVEGDGDKFNIVNTETGEEKWVEVGGKILHPIFSPDSSSLFYFQAGEGGRTFSLHMMEIPGFASRMVVHEVYEQYARPPVWLMP